MGGPAACEEAGRSAACFRGAEHAAKRLAHRVEQLALQRGRHLLNQPLVRLRGHQVRGALEVVAQPLLQVGGQLPP